MDEKSNATGGEWRAVRRGRACADCRAICDTWYEFGPAHVCPACAQRRYDAKNAAVDAIQRGLCALDAAPLPTVTEPERLPVIRMSRERFMWWRATLEAEPQMAPWDRFALEVEGGEPFRVECCRVADGTAQVCDYGKAYARPVLHRALAAIWNAPRREPSESRGIVRIRGQVTAAEPGEIVVRIDDTGRVTGALRSPYERRAPGPHVRKGHPHRHWVGSGEEKRLVERWHNETRVKGGTVSATHVIR